MRMPGSFHATRLEPGSAGLGATLRHAGGWPMLSITGSPQTLELELVNRTPYRLTTRRAQLRLRFRPGILTALDQLVLAPQSEAAWTLAIEQDDGHGEVSWVLATVDNFSLAPGGAFTIRFDGVSADPAGGSRATRVQLDYRGFFQAAGAQVTGTRLLHLPVLRRHEPVGVQPDSVRSGSMAVCGPFTAGFIGGAELLNDGVSDNSLLLRIVNTSGEALELSHAGDEATRLHLSFRIGETPAGWGLIEAQTDHVGIELDGATDDEPPWQVDHLTLRRTLPGRWHPREALDLKLTVHTSAPAGDAQLILTYENLPHADDGDLVLLLHLGPTAARAGGLVSVAPIELRGERARLSFHPEEAIDTQPSAAATTPAPLAALPAPSIRVNRAEGTVGRLDLDAPAGMQVAGDLQLTGVLNPPATFTLGGSLTRFYPVLFEDLAWDRGELRLEVFRANTHVDGSWHGSMMTRIACHSERFGHGSGHWSIEVRQWTADGPGAGRRFVGGFRNDPYRAVHVLWLAGQTTYQWRAEHPARLMQQNLAQPGDVVLDEGSAAQSRYEVLARPAGGFDAPYVRLHRLDRTTPESDASPLPAGAIVLWPRDDDPPYGWGVCDGKPTTPDLSATFPTGLKYIRKLAP